MSAFDKYPELLSPGFIEEYDFAGSWTNTHPDREYEERDVAAALMHFRGNYSRIAMALGRSRSSVENYICRNHILRNLRDEIREAMLDEIEDGYLNAALSGDNAARKFFLNALGKNRGYGLGVQEVDENAMRTINPTIDCKKLSDEALLEIIAASKQIKQIAG